MGLFFQEDNDDESKLVEELGDAAFETLVVLPENPQPDEIMNDDVSIEGYEKNDSDKETAEINNCLKSNNEEKNDQTSRLGIKVKCRYHLQITKFGQILFNFAVCCIFTIFSDEFYDRFYDISSLSY